MIRYFLLATALRLASATGATRRLYRRLGNALGPQARAKPRLLDYYVDRARLIWGAMDRYPIAQPGDRILELGTGWLHWESTLIRLRREVQATLFDVWDNRQLPALQAYFAHLGRALGDELHLPPQELPQARALLAEIGGAASFQELYAALGCEYVVEPSGELGRFPDHAFQAIISFNVLEHVEAGILPGYVRDMARILAPGGYALHKIDVGDHLAYFVPGVSKKNYLRYSEGTWQRFFQNRLQYFNRVQRPTWLAMFREAGLELVHQEAQFANIASLPIARQYAGLSQEDLACVGFQVVYRRGDS